MKLLAARSTALSLVAMLYLTSAMVGAGAAPGPAPESYQARPSDQTATGECVPGRTKDLGLASEVGLIQSSVLLGNRLYMASRGIQPALLGAFDMTTRQYTGIHKIPSGGTAWAMTSYGDSVYVGMTGTPDLYQFDTRANSLTKVASFAPEADSIWSADASPDGKVYVGTSSPAGLYEYDTSTGLVRDLGNVFTGNILRAVVATHDTVYAGGHGHGLGRAQLVAIDRQTGEIQDVLPPEVLEGETYVFRMAVTDDWLLVGLNSSPELIMVNLDDHSDYRIVPFEPEIPGTLQGITSFVHTDEAVFFMARPSGSLHRYDLASGVMSELATPYEGDMTHGLSLQGSTIVGTAVHGAVWTYDIATGDVTGTEVAPLGFAGSEAPQSIAARNDLVYVGGNHAIQVHDVRAGTSTRFFLPDGEPKAMTFAAGSRLYAAVYPAASIWEYDELTGKLTRAAVIGNDQQRPRDIHYDKHRALLFVGTTPIPGRPGGALSIYEPASGDLDVVRNIISDHSIRSITSDEMAVYVGSEQFRGQARLIAYDPSSDSKLWETVPITGNPEIRSLEAFDGRVFGMTADGTFFVVDATSGSLLHRSRIDVTGGDLTQLNGSLYAVNRHFGRGDSRLYRINPQSYQVELLATGPAARFNDYPQIANDGTCHLYMVQGFNLVQHTPPRP